MRGRYNIFEETKNRVMVAVFLIILTLNTVVVIKVNPLMTMTVPATNWLVKVICLLDHGRAQTRGTTTIGTKATPLGTACAVTERVVDHMRSHRPTWATWTPGYLPRRTIATLLAAIGPAATAVSASAASLLPASEYQDRSARVTCVTNAWDASLSLEAAAVEVAAERPPAVWPPPAPAWWQPTSTSPTTAGAPISLNPESTSVVHWLGMKQRLLAAHASQLEFLVTRSYEHVQLDHAGRVVSSRRGDLDSVVTVDIRPF